MNYHSKGQEAYQLLHQGILALAGAEEQGMRIDVEYCQRTTAHLTRQIKRLETNLESTELVKAWRGRFGAGFTLGGNDQLAWVLYEHMKIKPPKATRTGKGSVDEATLKQIDLPELKVLLQTRKLKKVRDTYLGGFLREQVDGVVHPFFNLNLVRSFRSSSDSPNFQNIPRRDREAMQICRRAIYPRKGHQLLEVDFSGLEVSIAACYHKDPNMLEYLFDPTTDMHGDMAQQIFLFDTFDRGVKRMKLFRDAAKNGFVFPQFYGDYHVKCAQGICRWVGLPEGRWRAGTGKALPGGGTIADHLISKGIESYKQFEEYIKKVEDDFWGRRFYKYNQWKEYWYEQYQKQGYVDMLTGFRCSGVMSRNEVINYPIQGAAFHCLLWCFIELDRMGREQGWRSRLVGQIHDALILDVHPDELEMVGKAVERVTTKDLAQEWPWIIVPLGVEAELCGVDRSWAEKEDYTL